MWDARVVVPRCYPKLFGVAPRQAGGGLHVNFDTAFLIRYLTKKNYSILLKINRLRAGILPPATTPLRGRRLGFTVTRATGQVRALCKGRRTHRMPVDLRGNHLCSRSRRGQPFNP